MEVPNNVVQEPLEDGAAVVEGGGGGGPGGAAAPQGAERGGPAANNPDLQHLVRMLNATAPTVRSQTLTEEELRWVKNLQTAFALEPELDPLPDFALAQLAIVSQGDVPDGLRRAQGWQGFIEEYDILNSVNQGVQCVREFLEARPSGDFMYLSNKPLESPLFVSDLAKAQGFASRVRLRGYFYLLQAAHTDLDQIRFGAIHMLDCKGFDWAANFGWKEYLGWWNELGGWYPLRTNSVRIYHSPTVANVMFSMGRKLMPAHERDRLQFGLCSSVGPLRNLYNQPNPEEARERVLSRVREGLERRYAIETSFKLEG